MPPKTESILILLCLLLLSTSLKAQLPAGAIASYPFDNSAVDNSPSGYNGTLVSTAADANRFGTASGATAFTASTSTGTLPAALATALSNDFSIGYWLKTSMTAPSSAQWYGGDALVDAEVCGQTDDWGTALIDGGKIAMGIGNPDITIKSALATYNDGAWHFITATRNQSAGTIILYVDGSQVATASSTNTGTLSAPNLVGLGRNPCVASGVFTGSLDDVIAYNRVLSAVEVSNLYSFYSAVPLPLQWVSFTGVVNQGAVSLQWTVADEIRNDRFQIERSDDGLAFSTIGVVPQSGGPSPSGGSAVYQYTDKDPDPGNNFYRIRQIDIDGKNTLSSILEFSIGQPLPGIHLRVNPVTDEATIVNNDQLMIQKMRITDLSGRVLIDQTVQSANTQINISLPGLPPGYYLMDLTAGGHPTTLRFIKL
jgi:hypothetical protein